VGIEPDVKLEAPEAKEPGKDKDVQLDKAIEIVKSKIK
jgi:C-terminal processing protease CtpA/Prc